MPDAVKELERMVLGYCAGSTHTLLSKLSANIKKVCLVIVEYAGISTNPGDIRTFVICLEYIVVYRFRETGKYEVYSRSKILNNDSYFLSDDSIEETQNSSATNFPVESLNAVKPSGMPLNTLVLK